MLETQQKQGRHVSVLKHTVSWGRQTHYSRKERHEKKTTSGHSDSEDALNLSRWGRGVESERTSGVALSLDSSMAATQLWGQTLWTLAASRGPAQPAKYRKCCLISVISSVVTTALWWGAVRKATHISCAASRSQGRPCLPNTGCIPMVDAVPLADLHLLAMAAGYKISTKHPAVFLHTNNE